MNKELTLDIKTEHGRYFAITLYGDNPYQDDVEYMMLHSDHDNVRFDRYDHKWWLMDKTGSIEIFFKSEDIDKLCAWLSECGVDPDTINRISSSETKTYERKYGTKMVTTINEFAKAMESNKKVLYSAVVLTGESRDKLIEAIGDRIPEGWKTVAHHMTIIFGKPLPDPVKDKLDSTVRIDAYEIGISDKAIAVKVDRFPAFETDGVTPKKIPHVTVAVSPNGKPVDSNFITEWEPLEHKIQLIGTVKEIYN